MRGLISTAIFSMLCFFSPLLLAAEPVVQAIVDRNDMGLGDTLTLSVSIQSEDSLEVQEPRVPQLSGFDLVNSWTSSSASSKLVQGPNGMEFETVRRQDFNYMLTPQRTGSITIPGFEVVVEGQTYTTKPIVVKVSQNGSGAAQMPRGLPQMDDIDEAEEMFNQLLQRRGAPQPKQFRNLPEVNPNEAFFIRAEVDRTDVYEGEQVTVDWYIYTRGNLLSLDRLKFPDLKGFWKEIIEEVPALNFTQEVINGVPYRKALLASHALFPIKPGSAVIDEYKIKAQVQIPTSAFGAFGFGKPYSFQRSSERVKINVRPLPTEGKPADFSGAVGQFDVSAKVEGNQFPVNQPFSLKVRFEGSGNAKLIELPSLDLPNTIEVYDTKSDSKFFKNGRSYKEFEVLLIPREEGQLTIPALGFSIFDPSQKRYVMKSTEPMTIKIVPGAAGSNSVVARLDEEGKQAPAKPKEKTLPNPVLTWDAGNADPFSNARMMFWLCIYSLIGVILLLKARKELGWGQKQRNLKADLHKRVKILRLKIDKNDWRGAGTEMTNMIYHIFGAVSGLGGAHLEMGKLLDQAPPSLRRELGAELGKLIEISQILSFAPESVVGALKESSALKKTANELEKVLLKAIELSENQTADENIPAR
jgi:hypothetical protein